MRNLLFWFALLFFAALVCIGSWLLAHGLAAAEHHVAKINTVIFP
jgi:hypothetical protein